MRKLASLLSNEQASFLEVAESKKILREALLQERKEDYKKASKQDWGPIQFQKALQALNFNNLEELKTHYRIASYFPIRNELDLNLFVEKDWLFPTIKDKNKLAWFEYEDGTTNYHTNTFGIKEKKSEFCFELNKEHLPLVCLVPGLAASIDGVRLGYGGGYYDKFLQKYQKDIVTVLCLPSEKYIFDKLPFTEKDQRVDYVVY